MITNCNVLILITFENLIIIIVNEKSKGDSIKSSNKNVIKINLKNFIISPFQVVAYATTFLICTLNFVTLYSSL